jgi:RNA polymerase-binding protein DksA
LRAIDAAQRRIDDGTYGICESCGKRIPVARLRVRPAATMCVDCASKS